jgi:hypothetical protein
MQLIKVLTWVMWSLIFTLTSLPGLAADYPVPQEGSWVVRDFRFHTGEVLPELRLHYTTVGAPTGEPVLLLHGTTGSGAGMLTPRSLANSLAPGSRSTLAVTTSSCRTPSATANRPNPPTDSARAFLGTTTTTWSPPNTGSSPSTWACATCGWCSGNRWAACTPGSGPRNIRTSWTSQCPWHRCRLRCPDVIG